MRYVDNRLTIVDQQHSTDHPLAVWLHKWFYGRPIEVEEVEDINFLGFDIYPHKRQVKFIDVDKPWKVRSPANAGTNNLTLSGFRSRAHLIVKLFFSKGIDSRKFERPFLICITKLAFHFPFCKTLCQKRHTGISQRKKNAARHSYWRVWCVRNPVSQGNACPVLTFPCSLFYLWFHVIIIHFAQRNKERQEKQSVPTLLGLGILMRKPSRASETAKRQRQISFIFIPASV